MTTDAATHVELGDLKTIARDRGWDKAFHWIDGHQKAEGRVLTPADQEAARHRVLDCLVRSFGDQLEDVSMGDALIACEEIVQTVTEDTHDPVRSPVMSDYPYIKGDVLYVHRDDLTAVQDMLPPGAEMRVLSIMHQARHDIIVLNRKADPGPYEVNPDDMRAVLEALEQRHGQPVPERGV